jgi:hypothetical protein
MAKKDICPIEAEATRKKRLVVEGLYEKGKRSAF